MSRAGVHAGRVRARPLATKRLEPDPLPPVIGEASLAPRPLLMTAGMGRRRGRSYFLNLSALAMTDTDEKLIVALAMIGLSRIPNHGYSTPAATGTPTTL